MYCIVEYYYYNVQTLCYLRIYLRDVGTYVYQLTERLIKIRSAWNMKDVPRSSVYYIILILNYFILLLLLWYVYRFNGRLLSRKTIIITILCDIITYAANCRGAVSYRRTSIVIGLVHIIIFIIIIIIINVAVVVILYIIIIRRNV